MSKYCHDDGIHMCLVECEGCSAYYDDKESENYLITEKDQRNFIENEIRADERRKFAIWLNEKDYLGKEDTNPQSFTEHYWQELNIDKVLAEYEKEK